MCFSSRCFFVWRVRRCESGDYGKRVPDLGSTHIQEMTEGQRVIRHRETERSTGN